MKLPDKVYDILNKIQRWLPSLAAFYLVIAAVWTLPFGDEVSKTIAAVATLIAAFLEVMDSRFNKENVVTVTPIDQIKNDLEGGK